MSNWLRRLWPSSLREQMVVVLVPLLLVACVSLGYLLTQIGEEAILEEKSTNLQGINRMQLLRLHALGGFAGLEAQQGSATEAPPDKAVRVTRLNAALRELTDDMATAFPGVGLGYYHRELDAIVTYGPTSMGTKWAWPSGRTTPGATSCKQRSPRLRAVNWCEASS